MIIHFESTAIESKVKLYIYSCVHEKYLFELFNLIHRFYFIVMFNSLTVSYGDVGSLQKKKGVNKIGLQTKMNCMCK